MNEQIPRRVLEILEWPAVRQELRKRCATSMGGTLVDGIAPLEVPGARTRMREITELKEITLEHEPPDFSGAADIGPLLDLAEKGGILKIEDLALVRSFTVSSGSIVRYLRTYRDDYPTLADAHARMDRLEDIAGLLASSITEKNELNDATYPELKRIRSEIYNARQEMERTISRIIHSPHMESVLQEKIFTTRNDRSVILVKANMKERVGGTVHDISASGATYYIEPNEITPLNNRALTLEKELQAETARILRMLSAQVSGNAGRLRGNLDLVARLDFIAAAARLSIDLRGAEPEITDGPVIRLYRARHPLLYLMSPDTVVSNDIDLGAAHRCLIVSGANTGGKTVLLKTIGLCVLMAMYGLHLPAGPDSRIGVFTKILADIGDDQSLSQSLSTFSGQIMIINEMLAGADERTLVIIDEIIVGTNPRQGAALAQAILESLIETGSIIVATTHYSELKELPAVDGRFQNASVSFDLATLRPTYRLMSGLPGVSYAIEIASNYGLPQAITTRASALLDSRELSMEALVEKIQQYEQEIAEERGRLDGLSKGLEREKRENEELMTRLEKRAQEIKQKEGIDFIRELREHRRRVSDRITALQRMNMKEAGAVNRELSELETSIHSKLAGERGKLYAGKYRPMDPEEARPGDRVLILSLEKEGALESVDLQRKQAAVLLGSSIRSTFPFGDLYVPAQRPAPAPVRQRAKRHPGIDGVEDGGGEIPSVIQTSYNTVDLRGMRVEEGLRSMEREFDHMVRSGIRTVVVIHGHGTGAMKEAVRTSLSQSLYAADFRPGDTGEGGDGVTIVRLRG
ncbi:MAG TPA: Smr/MutS family protein [Spirochaetota bacterium]|nr:Smr/MutS family protein [Spirochaetota bacterium]HOD15557.1 Smr/MutS family protein [Spirochaetota bacterium]HPG49224.1 Smr/MutS family protein [Spirochaetota bacterium]HPN13468.1 Smr/MutS family protein [Spirochaetota bacterium]